MINQSVRKLCVNQLIIHGDKINKIIIIINIEILNKRYYKQYA